MAKMTQPMSWYRGQETIYDPQENLPEWGYNPFNPNTGDMGLPPVRRNPWVPTPQPTQPYDPRAEHMARVRGAGSMRDVANQRRESFQPQMRATAAKLQPTTPPAMGQPHNYSVQPPKRVKPRTPATDISNMLRGS